MKLAHILTYTLMLLANMRGHDVELYVQRTSALPVIARRA